MPISLNWNTVAETDSLRDYPERLDMCILRVTGYMCRTLGVGRKEECDWIAKAALRDAHRQIRERDSTFSEDPRNGGHAGSEGGPT